MPTAVTDPFGNTFQACSISTAVKAKFGKDAFPSEAAWAKHVKTDAWHVLRQKIQNGELKKNTILARAPGHMKLKLTQSDGGVWRVQTLQGPHVIDDIGTMAFEMTGAFTKHDWDFGPNMAKLAQAEKAVVNTPDKLADWLDKHDNEIEYGDVVATVKPKDYGDAMNVKYDGFDGTTPQFKMDGPYGTELMDLEGLNYYHKSKLYDVEYKMGQNPTVPPAAGLPVASTSKSVGALTNEDAATMFVKTKDKLATEAGINIKGASGKLDDLVYKTIADQAGYTPAEMLAKVEAYKASGKKLSALKKKVLPKSGNPTKVPTQKAVDNATAAVKKEEILPEEVPQVWDEEAVAKAYIKAKDHVVANNSNGWTLYTKNPDFDAEIHKWMQADLGPIKKEVADTAIANYIANTQKLSVLKKQMIKKGELTPQADTLKGPKAKAGDASGVDALKLSDVPFGSKIGTVTNTYGTMELDIQYMGQGKFKIGQQDFADKDALKKWLNPPGQSETYWTPKWEPPKPAPKATGNGGVGSVGQDPKKIAKEQQLTEAQEHEVFQKWETLNLPISSSGAKLYGEAKTLAAQYGLGEDVLPILKAVDKGKTAKFGLTPDKNKLMYETKVVEHLKNPEPVGYTPPSHSGTAAASKSYGELPPDAGLFRDIKPHEMNDIWAKSMVRPTSQQQHAIRTYTGSSYHDINGPLRFSGKKLDDVLHARHIQNSMSPLPEDILSRRGTSLKGLGMDSFEQLEASVGKTFMEPAFSSTAVGGSGQFGGQVTLHIQSPKGTKASWFKPFSNIPGENELVLAARTHFQILKVDVSVGPYGDKRTIVHVRVVKQEKV